MTRTLASILLAAALLDTGPVTAQAADTAVAAAPAVDRARIRMNQRVFDAVWNEVRRRYYDPTLNGLDWRAARDLYRPQALAASNDRELYRVLNAMLDRLEDEHASAASPAAVARDAGRTTARPVMGLSLFRQGDRWRIESIREGSPAEDAGVPVGWIVESVDGVEWGPDLDLVEEQPVVVVLEDENGMEHSLTLTPRVMPPAQTFTARWASPTVLVLDVDRFEEGLGDWMGAVLAGLPDGADLVLDLRGNPGGRMIEAQNLLSCFLPHGVEWAVRTSRAGREATLTVEPGCGELTEPVDADLVVLVATISRSAAELTPAVLQEQGRAVIVGEQTPGAVLISQDTRLPDGGELTLSRANFITAAGVRLEKRGVTPDVVVETTLAERRAGRDRILEAALAVLSEAD